MYLLCRKYRLLLRILGKLQQISMAPSAPTLLPSLLFLLLPRAQSAFVLHPPLPAARTRARAVSASMALEAAPFVALADAVQDVAADRADLEVVSAVREG